MPTCALLPDSASGGRFERVPPPGIVGIKPPDHAEDLEGVVAYGAVGVGGLKMKIHKAAIRQLFAANDQMLDAEEVFDIGRQIES